MLPIYLALLCGATHAASVVWTNTAGGSWKTAANWSPNRVPGGSDDAVINLNGNYTVTVNANASVGNLTLGGTGTPRLSITAGTFKIATNGVAAVVNGATLGLAGGIIDGDGVLQVAGVMNWTKGEIRTLAYVAPGGSLNLSSGNTKSLNGGFLDNEGAIVWSGNGVFQINAIGSAITNRGLFEVQNDLAIGATNKAYFINQGTFRKTTTSGVTEFGDVEFRNSGTIDLQTGSLGFPAGKHSFNNGSSITGPGGVWIYGAEVTLSGNVAAETPMELQAGGTLKGAFTLSGALNFSAGSLNSSATINGTLNVMGGAVSSAITVNGPVNLSAGSIGGGPFVLNGRLNWTGGTFASTKATCNGDIDWFGGVLTGDLLVQNGRTLTVSGGTLAQINGGTLTNRGEVRLLASTGIKCDNAALIYNYGSFFLGNDAPFSSGATTVSRFYNYGSLLKAGPGQLKWDALEFYNRGVVDVQSGILSLGTRAHNLGDNSAITGSGRFQIISGSLLLGTNVSVSPIFEWIDGALTAAGALNADIEWSKGTLNGTLTVPVGRNLHLTGNGTKTFPRDSVLNVAGTAEFDGNGSLLFFANATINNSGVFEIQNDGNFTFNGNDKAWFNNSGILRKTVSTSALPFDALQLVNTGTLDLQAGDVSLTANVQSLQNGSQVIGPGSVRVNGATLALAGSVSSGSPVYLASGVLSGTATLAGPLNVSGGQVAGVVTVNGPVVYAAGEVSGTLTANQAMDWSGGTISGTLMISPSGNLTVKTGGTRTLTGVLNNAGSATVLDSAFITLVNGTPLVNSGLFEVQDSLPFKLSGSGKPILNNSGTFRKTIDSGTLALSFLILQNSGTVDVQAGGIDFTLNSHTLNSGSRLTGPGPIRIDGASVTMNNLLQVESPFELASGFLYGDATINGSFTMSGGQLPGVVVVTNLFNWSGGEVKGALTVNKQSIWQDGLLSGSLTVPVNARADVVQGGNKSVSGVLQNSGITVFSNNANIQLLGGTPIVNSGVLEVQNEQPFKPNGTTKVNLINGGTLRKTISNKQMKLQYVLLQNSGTLDVQAGEISLLLNSHNFSDGTRVTGTGVVRVAGATLNVAGNVALGPPLALDSGALAGNATFNGPFQFNGGEVQDKLIINGPLAWSGGLLKGGIYSQGAASWSGGEIDGWLAIATNGTLAIGGNATKSIKGGTLTNNGFATVSAPVTIQADGGALIQNFGAFHLPVNLNVATPWGGKPVFNNFGALCLTNGAGVFNFPGKFFQFQNGLLEMEINGRNAGADFGQIVNAPNVALDGALKVRVAGGFVPVLGDRLEIIKCAELVGVFAAFEANTPQLSPDFSPTNVVLFAAAPVITSQPQSVTLGVGNTASFSAGAYGTKPMSYQWFTNGVPIVGFTNSSLTLNNVQVAQEGNYTVVISNAWGSVTSAMAVLTVIIPPAIITQPLSLTVNQGHTATFTVQASGTHLAYRWRLGNTWLAGATNATLVLPNVTAANAGSYRVEVSNLGGTVVSVEAVLTVIIPPTITEQPVSQNVNSGSNPTLSVKASGTAPFSYLWLKDGVPIRGATNSSLTLNNVGPDQAGVYVVLVANAAGSATSDPAIIAIKAPPVIVAQPLSQSATVGSTVTLGVTATGVPAPTYQWRKNGVTIYGATNASLVLTNVQPGAAGDYTVVVLNSQGSVESAEAHLTVVVPELFLTDRFADRGIIYTTNGFGHGTNVGATKEVGEPAHAGKGSATNSVWISWWAPANGIATFSTAGSDFDTVLAVYRGTAVNGLSKVAADDDSAGFHCSKVSFNAVAGTYYQIAVAGDGAEAGNITLIWDLNITAELLPQITQAPFDVTGNTNDTVSLQVTFDAFEPTAIQWFFQGQTLPGATNAIFAIPNLQEDKVGGYAVRLTGASGRNVVSPPGDVQINTEGATGASARNKFFDAGERALIP